LIPILLAVLIIVGTAAGFRISFKYYKAKADLEVTDVV
jgi:hypothetical protein